MRKKLIPLLLLLLLLVLAIAPIIAAHLWAQITGSTTLTVRSSPTPSAGALLTGVTVLTSGPSGTITGGVPAGRALGNGRRGHANRHEKSLLRQDEGKGRGSGAHQPTRKKRASSARRARINAPLGARRRGDREEPVHTTMLARFDRRPPTRSEPKLLLTAACRYRQPRGCWLRGNNVVAGQKAVPADCHCRPHYRRNDLDGVGAARARQVRLGVAR